MFSSHESPVVFLTRAAIVVVKLVCALVSPKACQRHSYPPQFVISRDLVGHCGPEFPVAQMCL